MPRGKGFSEKCVQGSIWFIGLNVSKLGKHIEKGKRPYVVISGNAANLSSPNVTVVPCTTRLRKTKIPSHTYVNIKGVVSVVMCEQPVTVGKEYLTEFWGTLTPKEIKKVLGALKKHFEMETVKT